MSSVQCLALFPQVLPPLTLLADDDDDDDDDVCVPLQVSQVKRQRTADPDTMPSV